MMHKKDSASKNPQTKSLAKATTDLPSNSKSVKNLSAKKRVFSGIQPTGEIHLGNYLGAVKNWVDSQDEYENIFFIANSHSITMPHNPKELESSTYKLAAMLLACGIDTQKSALFVQSAIDYHPALAWILDCNISMGDMGRMTQFKDKSAKSSAQKASVGLFNYPALMAADILLYEVDFVPVGQDQKQHLELTRNVAQKFNRDYGECFKIPNPLIQKVGAKIMGLDNPQIKMSKSQKGENHAIFLLDSPEVITRKIKKATTDSAREIVFDENRLGLYNLLCMYEIFSEQSREAIEAEFAGKGYGELKSRLGDLLVESLRPIREKYDEIMREKGYIKQVLESSADKVRPIAKATYERAKNLIGLV